MMKKFILLTGVIILMASACKKDDSSPSNNDIGTQINNYPKEALTTDEKQSLMYMREEEKLAHDVYITFYQKWGISIYNNIASSELTHTNAVLSLINKYALVDPVGTNGVGEFEDSTLQTVYNQLIIQGSKSNLDALKVGATIEDLDIYDLQQWTAKVDNQDILFVFNNLNKGSRNHLRSYYSQIVNAGGTYAPQYIDQSLFNSIVNSEKETGSW